MIYREDLVSVEGFLVYTKYEVYCLDLSKIGLRGSFVHAFIHRSDLGIERVVLNIQPNTFYGHLSLY